MKKINSVLNEVLKKINPSKEDLKFIREYLGKFKEKLEKKKDEQKNNPSDYLNMDSASTSSPSVDVVKIEKKSIKKPESNQEDVKDTISVDKKGKEVSRDEKSKESRREELRETPVVPSQKTHDISTETPEDRERYR